jgi:hypothetical protein
MLESLTKYATTSWSAPEIPVKIEYSHELMEEVRAFVWGELQQLPHGGMEAGGVFFGQRREGSIRIVTWRPFSRPVSRELDNGISPQDRVVLVRVLGAAEMDPALKDLVPLGWFIAHAQTGISLAGPDLALFNGFFPDAWQFTLVLKRLEGGALRGGLFAREADGSLKSDRSYHEFSVEPLRRGAKAAAEAPAAVASEPKSGALGLDVNGSSAEATAEAPDEAPAELPSFQIQEHSFGGEKWLWLLPVLLVAGVIAFVMYHKPVRMVAGQPISLRISTVAANVTISWDKTAAAIQAADHATIKIQDGTDVSQLALTTETLQSGSTAYIRHSGDVGIEMTVYQPGGSELHEFARLAAPETPASALSPGIESAEAAQLRIQRLEYEAQIQRLREEAQRQAARADQLQDVVRILQKRLNIEDSKK